MTTPVAVGGALVGFTAGPPRILRPGEISPLRLLVNARPSFEIEGELEESRARWWNDLLNVPGAGGFELLNDDPAIALLVEGRIVLFELDGDVVFGIKIGPHEIAELSEQEEAGQRTKYEGEGLFSILDEGVVGPSIALEASDLDPDEIEFDRIFGAMSPQYDDAGWGFAQELAPLSGPSRRPGTPFSGPPVGMPQNAGAWIYGPDGDILLAPSPDDTYYRKTFTVTGADVRARILWGADNEGELWLNGVQRDALTGIDTGNFLEAHRIDVTFPVGENTIYAHVRNLPNPWSAILNPGSLGLAAFELVDDQEGALIVATDDTWKVVQHGPPPGMTAGQAFRIPFDECKARGCFPDVTLGFSDLVDSAGIPWAEAPTISTKVLTKLRTFAEELTVSWWDCWMDPATRVFHAWQHRGQALDDLILEPAPADNARLGNLGALTRRRG